MRKSAFTEKDFALLACSEGGRFVGMVPAQWLAPSNGFGSKGSGSSEEDRGMSACCGHDLRPGRSVLSATQAGDFMVVEVSR